MRCRAFTFLLNLVSFLFIYERFIVQNPLRYYWEKICSIHYLYFSFEKHVPSQVLKDFSVEDLETIPRTFLSKFSSEIHLSRIINYWGSIFTSYLTEGTFSLVCVLSVFLSFFHFCCFSFSIFLFPSQTLTIARIAGNREGIIIFLVFHFYTFQFQPIFIWFIEISTT